MFDEEFEPRPESPLRLWIRKLASAVAVLVFRFGWPILALMIAVVAASAWLASERFKPAQESASGLPVYADFSVLNAPVLVRLESALPESLDQSVRALQRRLNAVAEVDTVVVNGGLLDWSVPDDPDARDRLLDRLATMQPVIAPGLLAMSDVSSDAERAELAASDRLVRILARVSAEADLAGRPDALPFFQSLLDHARAVELKLDKTPLDQPVLLNDFSWVGHLWPSEAAGRAFGILHVLPKRGVSDAALLASVRQSLSAQPMPGVDVVVTGPTAIADYLQQGQASISWYWGLLTGLFGLVLAFLITRDLRLLVSVAVISALFLVPAFSVGVVLTGNLNVAVPVLVTTAAVAMFGVAIGARVRGQVMNGVAPRTAIHSVYDEAFGAAMLIALILVVGFGAMAVFMAGSASLSQLGKLGALLSLVLPLFVLFVVPAALRLMALHSGREVKRSRGTIRAMFLGMLMMSQTGLRTLIWLAGLAGFPALLFVQFDADPLSGAPVGEPEVAAFKALTDMDQLSPWALQVSVPVAARDPLALKLRAIPSVDRVVFHDGEARRMSTAERGFGKEMKLLLSAYSVSRSGLQGDAGASRTRSASNSDLSALISDWSKGLGQASPGIRAQAALNPKYLDTAGALSKVLEDLVIQIDKRPDADALRAQLAVSLGRHFFNSLAGLESLLSSTTRRIQVPAVESKRHWQAAGGVQRLEIYPVAKVWKDDLARRQFVTEVQAVVPTARGLLVNQVDAEAGASQGIILSLLAATFVVLMLMLMLLRNGAEGLGVVLWSVLATASFFALHWLDLLVFDPAHSWLPVIGLISGFVIGGMLVHRSQRCPPAMNQLWVSSTGQGVMVFVVALAMAALAAALSGASVGNQALLLLGLQLVCAGALIVLRLVPMYPVSQA